MSDAVDLATFYQGEALRLSDAANVTHEINLAERLRVWLLDTWKHPDILPSDVVQRAPITALRERPAANKALGLLEEAGWIVKLGENAMVRDKARRVAYRIVKPTL